MDTPETAIICALPHSGPQGTARTLHLTGSREGRPRDGTGARPRRRGGAEDSRRTNGVGNLWAAAFVLWAGHRVAYGLAIGDVGAAIRRAGRAAASPRRRRRVRSG